MYGRCSGTFKHLSCNASFKILYLIYPEVFKEDTLSDSLIQIRNAVRQTHLNSKQFKLIYIREGWFCGYVTRQKSAKQIQTFSPAIFCDLGKDTCVQTVKSKKLENFKYNFQTAFVCLFVFHMEH